MSVTDTVLEVHDALRSARVSHGFGGALALMYVAEPRGTVDVDVNVFVPFDEVGDVVDVLAAIGLRPELEPAEWLPAAGIRLKRHRDPVPVDLFASIDERYGEIERRVERHPFGPKRRRLPFLSAEDLVLFKLSFGRDKDWVDVGAIASARPHLDVAYIEDQLIGLRGASMYPRLARLRRLLRSAT